jgi:hypothetical protein
MHLTLFWTAREPITTSYTVFVHLLAADGFNVVGADSLPRGGTRPTDQWAVGATVIDPHPIPIPSDMPAGEYRVEIGLYLLATGQRLIGVGPSGLPADHVMLPVTIKVESP